MVTLIGSIACRGPSVPASVAAGAGPAGTQPVVESCDIDALQRRVDAAAPGATVEACAGVVTGGLVLWQDIVLVAHPDGSVLEGEPDAPAVWVVSGAATLRGLEVRGGGGVVEDGFSGEDQPVGGGVRPWRRAGLRPAGGRVHGHHCLL